MHPMLGREVVEREQHIEIVGDLGGGFRPLRPVLGGERLRGFPCQLFVFDVVDLGQCFLRARMGRFRQRGKDIAILCHLCVTLHKWHYEDRLIMWGGWLSAEAVVVSALKLSA